MSFLIAQPAPDFSANAVLADGSIAEGFTLSQFKGDKYVVLFFWPLDFTFVCPSEIIAFDKAVKDFEARGVQVVGCSVDSQFTHHAWRNTAVNEGGIGQVQFPMVADLDKSIARDYGVLLNDSVALRGTFVIDKDGVVQSAVVNNLPIGRSIAETVRVVDALQHTEQHGEVCPANWSKGDEAMTPTAEGVASYLASNA
jgi:peroxiredoxin (alkyl hydroperoxide reductase subunit C)